MRSKGLLPTPRPLRSVPRLCENGTRRARRDKYAKYFLAEATSARLCSQGDTSADGASVWRGVARPKTMLQQKFSGLYTCSRHRSQTRGNSGSFCFCRETKDGLKKRGACRTTAEAWLAPARRFKKEAAARAALPPLASPRRLACSTRPRVPHTRAPRGWRQTSRRQPGRPCRCRGRSGGRWPTPCERTARPGACTR